MSASAPTHARIPILYVILGVLLVISIVPMYFYSAQVEAINRDRLKTNEMLLQNTVTRSLADDLAQHERSLHMMLANLSSAIQIASGGDIGETNIQSPELRALLENFVSSSDEIGEIARAFDQVQAEVLGLTSNEAGLRGKLGEMFVELSTRSQALVERQIRLIDELEQGERDSERLASLFKMDHIATRMRRYSQNLLILAGHELPGRWSQPATLVDVIRAAVSEIEDYERVSLSAQPGIAVSGPAVNDVVHLIAELTENATSLSAAGTPVDVSGRRLASGGVLVDITDQGVGMNPEVLAEANRRLENPPAMDLAVSRNMGLFVVGRLAVRHGIKVRLQPAAAGGLTALVWLPDAVAGQPDATAFPGDFDDPGPGWGAHGAGRPGRADPDRGPGPDRGPAEREALARSMHSAPVLEDVRARPPAVPAPASASGARQAPRHAWPDGAPRQLLRSQPPPASRPAALGQPPASAAVAAAVSAPAGAEPDLAEEPAEERRLPIYEAVESDWFGSGRTQPGGSGAAAGGWTSPSDRGWRAAQAAVTPASSGTTTAGLPVRVPRANLVPGTIGAPQPDAAPPSRSASAIRDRLSGFQRGTSQGRAAVGHDDHEQAP